MADQPEGYAARPRLALTELYWALPVSFDARDEPVSLREYVRGGNARPFDSLTDAERAEVAARRIELLPGYEMASLGAGVISQARAAAEVRARTPLGRQLADIEYRVVRRLIEEATRLEADRNG